MKKIQAKLKVVEIKGKYYMAEAFFPVRSIELPKSFSEKTLDCTITYEVPKKNPY